LTRQTNLARVGGGGGRVQEAKVLGVVAKEIDRSNESKSLRENKPGTSARQGVSMTRGWGQRISRQARSRSIIPELILKGVKPPPSFLHVNRKSLVLTGRTVPKKHRLLC